jgi:DNA-binding GntR family transcriptional regulator
VTAAEDAYHELREMILTTQLRPGQVLVEAELMESLRVGRTPLRDALRLLSHDGLVVIEPRRGTSVAPLTHADLHAIFEVRVAIEPVVAQAAIARATSDDLAALAVLARRARTNPAVESDIAVDEDLHELLVGIARNRFLEDFYKRLRDESLIFRYLTQSGMDTKRHQVRFLASIQSALSQRDADALTSVLVRHVEEFRERVWKSLSEESRYRPNNSSAQDSLRL